MSYSFTVKAKTKAEIISAVSAEFTKMVDGQPAHAADADVAEVAAGALLAIVQEPAEDEVVRVTVSGSLTWREEGKFTGASLNVAVSTGLAIHFQD